MKSGRQAESAAFLYIRKLRHSVVSCQERMRSILFYILIVPGLKTMPGTI